MAIRLTHIKSYDEFYEALWRNLDTNSSVYLARSSLDNVRQQCTENVQHYNKRLRQHLKELQYAIQVEYSDTTELKLALKIKERSDISKHIMNLREEVRIQVRILKLTSLNEVQEEAVEALVWFREKQQSSESTIPPKLWSPPAGISNNRPSKQYMPLSSSFCKSHGHAKDQCSRKKNLQIGKNLNLPPQRANSNYEKDEEKEKDHEETRQEEQEVQACEIEYQPHPEDYFQ